MKSNGVLSPVPGHWMRPTDTNRLVQSEILKKNAKVTIASLPFQCSNLPRALFDAALLWPYSCLSCLMDPLA